MQRDADLAAVLGASRGQWQAGVVEGDGRMDAARHRRQRMVMPAEQHRLEQDGQDGEPRDLVGAALFLAAPASDFITGHNLVVDGGVTLA